HRIWRRKVHLRRLSRLRQHAGGRHEDHLRRHYHRNTRGFVLSINCKNSADPGGLRSFCIKFVYFALTCFMRSAWSRMRLRMRRLLGVTSRSSSSLKYSRHCSRLMTRGLVRRRASSEPAARMLVSCFFLQMFTDMSSLRLHWPTTMP